MTAKIYSLTLQGLNATPLEIEVDVAQGLPNFIIVGLPDTAVSEARDRVRSAIKNSGFSFPRTRVTVNLAPAHTKKAGSLYDLPIALGILVAAGVIPQAPKGLYIGELALDGRLHPVRGALPLVHAAVYEYRQPITIPTGNSQEAALIDAGNVYAAGSLTEVVNSLVGSGENSLSVVHPTQTDELALLNTGTFHVDMSDVCGQHTAKRALEIAAAGNHTLLFSGPPGVGKSMLARALPSILPALTREEMVKVSMLHSLSTRSDTAVISTRPFRAPHHTISPTALLGGGNQLQPGELSLAHHGVLFLDELPEFRRDVIEALRQPLEDGTVRIHRANGFVEYPAECMVIAAVNPCPCGYFGVKQQYPESANECSCSPHAIHRYQQKLSGPLLDRIDISVQLSYISAKEMKELQQQDTKRESSERIRERVRKARMRQIERQGCLNAQLATKKIKTVVTISESMHRTLQKAMKVCGLSLRGYYKTLRVARTIADVRAAAEVCDEDIMEALNYVLSLDQG